MMNRIRDGLDYIRTGSESVFLSLLNPVFYSLRRIIRFRRKGYREPNQREESPSPHLQAQIQAGRTFELTRKYRLEKLQSRLNPSSFSTTLFHCNMIDEIESRSSLLGELPGRLDILDIGCKFFDSATGLYHAFGCSGGREVLRQVRLSGIEIDAWRICRDFHSRHDYAEYYLSLLPGYPADHRFIAGDLLDHRDHYDVITWFHPFLDAYPLLHWGLPGRMLEPGAMFSHAINRIRNGGLGINREPD
jgi:hypothetical protein